MQSETTALFPRLSPKSGVIVADGYGVRIFVSRRHLVVADGIGRHRRERRFARATAAIRRLVVLGHEGFVTLEALRWMVDLGIAFLQIDRDGRVLATSAINGLHDARLRRAQALAGPNVTGIEIARTILREKVTGQLTVLESFPEASRDEVAECLAALERAVSLDQLRSAEASAALAYWRAWEKVEVSFARRDLSRIPKHWGTVGPRRSPVTGTPRLAANPAHALLNYLYALAEAETRLACLSMGLDPALGFVHADMPNRDSLVLDVMEVLRPEVDAYVLRLLATRVLRVRDFYETPRGSCRILAPLTHHLAETLALWGKKVAPTVETIARLLTPNLGARPLPTPLTQSNRKAGQDPYRRRHGSEVTRDPEPPALCRTCGSPTGERGRAYCHGCLPALKQEQVADMLARSLRARTNGDRAHGGEAAKRRGGTNAQRMRDAAEWDRTHSRPDPDVFRQEILPALQGVSIRALMKATGLSSLYCSQIRRGLRVPHPRHWEALRIIQHTESRAR